VTVIADLMLEGRAMTGVDAGRHRRAHARADTADTAGGPGGPGGAPARAGGRSPAERLLVPLAPGVLGLVTGLYRLGVPPLWRDEAATKAIAGRPVSQILATMPHDDVVHGAYYLVVHVFIGLFGSADGALRLPSALAAAIACAVTAAIGRRLAAHGLAAARLRAGDERWYPALTGVAAGAVLALLPAMIRYAQEARSYAIVTMLAAIATYLLLRADQDGRPRWWAAYAAAVFLTGLFNIFGLLIVAAHGLTMLAVGRGAVTSADRYYGADFAAPAPALAPAAAAPRGRRALAVPPGWLAAGVAAAALLVPLVAMAYAQRNALSWMTATASLGRDTAALAHLWAGSPGLVWPVFALAALGVVASLIARPRSLSPASVALPWLVAPPAILLAASIAHPVYDQRYVEFCLPALAICVASGITWVWRLLVVALGQARRSPRWPAWPAWPAWLPAIGVAVALTAALVPAGAAVRQPGYRPDDLEYEAQVIAANAKPGDIVFFIPVNDRIVSLPFPAPWQKLRDIALAKSPASSDTLYGADVGPAELLKRFTRVTRVWVVSSSEVLEPAYLASPQATALDRQEFALVGAMRQLHRWRDGDTELTLYAAR
jgi:mannosyltransferase